MQVLFRPLNRPILQLKTLRLFELRSCNSSRVTQLGSGRVGLELPISEPRFLIPEHDTVQWGGDVLNPKACGSSLPLHPIPLHLRQCSPRSTLRPPTLNLASPKTGLSEAGPGSQHLGRWEAARGLSCPQWGWGHADHPGVTALHCPLHTPSEYTGETEAQQAESSA